MIDRNTIERIKDRADIVDVVSEFVSLRRVGANYRGLCPFHNDHTPSFYVSPSRRTCHCFVCGEGGDAVGFVMKHEQLSYPDALRWLARRYGIEVQERQLTDEQRREQSEREAMYVVNEWAATYFHDILTKDIDGRAVGMQYFRQRGIRDDIVEKFRLGFCLADRGAMSGTALKQGYSAEYLNKTGLCYTNDRGTLVDRFAGRAMFPWIGVSGKVVAFGGRVLDSRTKGVAQKYVNSPDSPIYHKDHELYGIFQAKRAIGHEDCVYMVEGYTDVLSMHQCGIENVVANSGTALSEYQVRLLHRFTTNIVLLYDGDAAGIKAALRGTDMLLREGMNVKVLLLPDGDDPDSFARKHKADEFRTYIKEHQTDFIEFKCRVLLEQAAGPRERSEAVASIVKSVSVITDPLVRATYIQDCALRLGYSEQMLTAKMNDEIRLSRDEARRQQQRAQLAATEAAGGSVSPSDMAAAAAYEADQAYAEQMMALEAGGTPAAQAPVENKTATAEVANPTPPAVETEIVRFIIKHGGDILYDNVETEDGQTVSLTVAQFIECDLAQDELAFATPLYKQILTEAVAHSGQEDWNCEQYFTLHPDYEVSSLALRLTAEPVILSERLVITPSQADLQEQTTHLLLDFRAHFIAERIEQLTAQVRQADDEHFPELYNDLREAQELRAAIAKRIGATL